jgi:hypothetical protein
VGDSFALLRIQRKVFSMAIFLRRDIQRLIEEAAAFLPEEKLTDLVRRLNLPNKQSIETQWELVWLIALSRVGDVNHEAAFPGGTSYPDIHFQQGSFALLAEVTTASDAGYENENPIREFDEAIYRLYAKFGTHGGFSVTPSAGNPMTGNSSDRWNQGRASRRGQRFLS